jgi:hypothetical protein
MKLIIAGAAVVAATSIPAVSTLAVAQMGIENKNVACVAKCNSDFTANKGRGHINSKSAGVVRRTCIEGCPNK